MGGFTIPIFSPSHLYLYLHSFLAGKVLPQTHQGQFSLIIPARNDLFALNSSDPLVFGHFSDIIGEPRGLFNIWVLNEWAGVN